MEGFNLIPKDGSVNVETKYTPPSKVSPVGGEVGASRVVASKSKLDILYWITMASVIAALLFSMYVIGMRFYLLSQISGVAAELVKKESAIDKSEIENFKTIDQRLGLIKSRLSRHVLTAKVFDVINQHIRTTAQVTEYKIEISDTELNVFLSAITPTFKDMAEQTEKLFDLKSQGIINSFTITNLAYEQDTRRVRFTLKLALDKSKYSAVSSN